MNIVRRLSARTLARLSHTKRVYDRCFTDYAITTPRTVSGQMKVWIDATIERLETGSTILELGSGTGRDASYFESHGIKVICSDVSEPAIERLGIGGHFVLSLDAVTGSYPMGIDAIFANAVVCHFNREMFSQMLSRSRTALLSNGILSISTKWAPRYQTETQRRLEMERYFFSWSTDELEKFLAEHGFKVEFLEVSTGIRSSSRWINVIARNDAPARLFEW